MAEAVAPRPGEALDADAVADFVASRLPELAGEVEILQFPSGASNLTYLVRCAGRELVLRRPPFGTKARTAHDMGREYRILSRLHRVFPYAPRPLAYCEDPAVLGEPFYLMERLEGIVLGRDLPPGMKLPPAAATALCAELIRVHVELHEVDYATAGLAELGHPEGYVGRQVAGWSKRYRAAATPDVPDNEALMTWLEARRPPDTDRPALIHNDYKLDNVVLGAADGGWRIRGVLDWEMATVGDPLMDLGCSLAYWVQADDPPAMQALRMMPTQLTGMLTRHELVAEYARRAGRELGDFRFYYAFGLFRLAVIVQQIYYRYTLGQTRDPRFRDFGRLCALLSATATAVTTGERGL